MTALGLLLILLGWILQLLTLNKKQKLNLISLLAFSAGTSFYVMNNFVTGDYITGSLHLLTLCVIMLIVIQFKHPSKLLS